jgi:hypothetical protein
MKHPTQPAKKNGCLNEKAAELVSIIHDFNMTFQLFDQAS